MEEVLLNPVLISVVALCVMSMKRVNVLLSLVISALIAGFCSNMSVSEVMKIFVSGMGGNTETALSYILLGTFAAAMVYTRFAKVLAVKTASAVKENKILLISIIAVAACLSQNLIPVHIAFIPILIPPLLNLMNRLKIDRRAVACALTFGLEAPYIVVPAGYGLIFQKLLYDNLALNGIQVNFSEIWKYLSFLGLAMLTGLLFAVFVSYSKPRTYETQKPDFVSTGKYSKFSKKHYVIIAAAVLTFVVQLVTGSLPLGAIAGLTLIFATGTINKKKTDSLMNEGVGLMGYIAFVMLAAAGYAAVINSTGGVGSFVDTFLPFIGSSRLAAAMFTLLTGLILTLGIGTSFGTIPVLSVLFVPVCLSAGISNVGTVIVIAAAAALGDAGSPASDTTLGPTSGLNADGKHDHIHDTCIPTFLHFNIPLIIFALIAAVVF